jgi:small-conductance mechanosensitive channel
MWTPPRAACLALLGWMLWVAAVSAAEPAKPAAATPSRVSPLTAEQLVQILDETVAWYRTLGTQQQSATQPSDLLILYANRQTADKVIGLAFDIARANAELLSSDAEQAQQSAAAASSPQALQQMEQRSDQRGAELQQQMEALRHSLASAPAAGRSELEAKLHELQGELDMVKAQKNLFDTMSQFVYENDAKRASVSALKARIDAIAASIPAASATPAAAPTAAATGAGAAAATPAPTLQTGAALSGLGIWDLIQGALGVRKKLATIDEIDQRTAALEQVFLKIRAAPNAQLQALSERSDALASAAEGANGATLKGLRDQFDTLAWLFTQTSAIALPLSKESVLLAQYRDNLRSWRDAVRRQWGDLLVVLRARLGVLLLLLAAVFMGGEIWRRLVLKYTQDPRRRYELLLLKNLVQWTLVILIVGLTLITRLSSFATFAGLITAGLAVAMQSVLVSVVGYFLLIGKYGVRVGDRVQVGNVVGEVINLGLVRMHLMELSSQGPLGPTGRIVAFANSIVFQSSGGLFRQIPGVNLTWHESTLSLPPGCDYAKLKSALLEALTTIVGEHSGEVARQTRTLKDATSSRSAEEVAPQVQLKFSPSGVQAEVRYPVPLDRAGDVDERVSEELLKVIDRFRSPESS